MVTAFDARRIRAMSAYASLELALSYLLSTLLGSGPKKGGAVFFRIVNTRSRCLILSDLLELEYGDEFKKFWASLEKRLNRLDQTRNKLIHWVGVVDYGNLSDTNPPNVSLKNPRSLHSKNSNQPHLSLDEMQSFETECVVTSGIALHFNAFLQNPKKDGSFREIFQRPIDDQTLKDFRLR